MNRAKIEANRRDIIRLLRPIGNKVNSLNFRPNETYEHKLLKFILFDRLQRKGYEIYTECIFLDNMRADCIAIKNGLGYGFEILVSETEQECAEKIKKYPVLFEWIMILKKEDIDRLDL
jgi:hypothetical protein